MRLVWFLGLTGLLMLGLVLSLGVGAVSLTPGEVIQALFAPETLTAPQRHIVAIVWDFRLARTLLAALVGAALGGAGAAYQGLFRNPLADPFIVGVSSGAALGATIVIVTGWAGSVSLTGGLGAVPLGAFVGALAAAGLVYGLASWGSGVPLVTLLLAGAAVSSFLGSVVWLLMFLHDQDLPRIVAWLMGSLSGRGWPVLVGILPYLLVGMIGLSFLTRPLDALGCGEETAQALGLRLAVTTALVLGCASLVTAAAVAAGGIIGFVGLIAPHSARILVGARHAVLLPASGLLGALLLVLADLLSRTLTAPLELPVGIVTALLGGPFFLALLRSRRLLMPT